ncbi:hypothetical protein M413DRAFT_144256 [Hebeloma cylindrosporum]|uniref:Uncharacterized protein n=1 Tax=Hebeloma cylindrosporum TaxID=76867 RepID=A0A0C3BTG4_HEBCY|nr:hypothetical protein M413DRAFT_144256 [Hebeloma cylindrosporum h7]
MRKLPYSGWNSAMLRTGSTIWHRGCELRYTYGAKSVPPTKLRFLGGGMALRMSWYLMTPSMNPPFANHLSKTSAMSVVGHAAAFGVFVEIPALLRSLSDCMDGTHGPFFEVSPELRADIQRPLDPLDPTERVEEYYGDWWNHPGVPHELLDIDRAWDSYCEQFRTCRTPLLR